MNCVRGEGGVRERGRGGGHPESVFVASGEAAGVKCMRQYLVLVVVSCSSSSISCCYI